MPATTQTFKALTREEIYSLIVQPVQQTSVALQVTTPISITATSIRLPKIVDDGGASWVVEGGAIPLTETTADEDEVTPAKVAGLRTLTREAAEDTSPAAATVLGQALVRSIASAIDAAFFGPTLPSPAPAGLRAQAADVNQLPMPKVLSNVDALLGAIAHGRDAGANVTSFVTSPALLLELAQLKEAAGSQRALLQPDPTSPDRYIVGGVQLLTSKYVEAGDVWAIPKSQTFGVVRKDAEVESSEHFLWANDSISVRGICRVGFGFSNPAAITRIRRATS